MVEICFALQISPDKRPSASPHRALEVVTDKFVLQKQLGTIIVCPVVTILVFRGKLIAHMFDFVTKRCVLPDQLTTSL